MKTLTYEVTNLGNGLTRTMSNYAVRVIVNSNDSAKAAENFKKIDDLQVNDSVKLTDNYGSTGGGEIIVERVS